MYAEMEIEITENGKVLSLMTERSKYIKNNTNTIFIVNVEVVENDYIQKDAEV